MEGSRTSCSAAVSVCHISARQPSPATHPAPPLRTVARKWAVSEEVVGTFLRSAARRGARHDDAAVRERLLLADLVVVPAGRVERGEDVGKDMPHGFRGAALVRRMRTRRPLSPCPANAASCGAAAYAPRRVGSRTSRSQSPTRLTTSAVSMRTRPGRAEIHQAESR